VLFVLKKINLHLKTQGQANYTTFHQRFEQIFKVAHAAAECWAVYRENTASRNAMM
jgi:hypothetical protein